MLENMFSRTVATSLVLILLFVAIFGLLLVLSNPMHHGGCPLMVAQKSICNGNTVEHISLWDAMFASIITLLATLISLALIVLRWGGELLFARERVRHRRYAVVSHRPTLFQELCSRGIHNSKEP